MRAADNRWEADTGICMKRIVTEAEYVFRGNVCVGNEAFLHQRIV